MQSYKRYFSRFFAANPDRLHLAAHSHHLWPDVTYDAHIQAWNDAAALADQKWDHVLGEVAPALRARIAGLLGLPGGSSIAFAAEPFDTLADRLVSASRSGAYDLVYVSHVHFNSGYVLPPEAIAALATTASDGRLVAIDGYHAFCALPVDLSAVGDSVFYLAGGYKYAMAGEGVCFMHCPAGFGQRPVNTGWFAGFGDLERGAAGVPYATDGMRFAGATFDPSGLYRMTAVLAWLDDIGVTIADIHRRVRALQQQFLGALSLDGPEPVTLSNLLLDVHDERGHFLTFRTDRAELVHRALAAAGVTTDYRGDRLRVGFGLYHDVEDVDEAVRRIAAVG